MRIHELTVLPDTPAELQKLLELAYNIYFSWNQEVISLFEDIDAELWQNCNYSPVRFISEVNASKLIEIAKDNDYIQKLDNIYKKYTDYLNAETWYQKNYSKPAKANIAYLCCEFGLHESIPIYSGGLGVLSGDHIKTASDLGLPLVGVGLLYKSGYFNQQVDQTGVQSEIFQKRNFYNIPLKPILDDDGNILKSSIDMLGEKLYFDLWKLTVGRVEIILLNTHIPQNSPELQIITNRLYDGDRERRIQQEILLGIGGYQALKFLGYNIDVYHCNEGHSAFLFLEHIKNLMSEKNLSFEEARYFVSESSCFTTHTPVPAGNERFSLDLMHKYFNEKASELGLSWEYFLSLGREFPDNHDEEFCLTILALKLCNRNNAVSKLHSKVAQGMWQNLYPKIPEHEVPIFPITNGVHGQTWTHSGLKSMLENVSGQKDNPALLYDEELYKHITNISDQSLWNWKNQRKEELVHFTREHLADKYTRYSSGQNIINIAKDALDPNILTIGFARRFASYKRGNLFLSDRERLKSIINNPSAPVQFIIAGKAHPNDNIGKDIIKSIHTVTRELNLEHRIVFLENYDLHIAQRLVAGVDIWLNTPIRYKEASGTSGMKASMNGALNLSISDGWWDEAFNENIGWNMSAVIDSDDDHAQNNIEADIFYTLLEREVVPLYYNRSSESKLPEKWIHMMKQAIIEVGSNFNSVRMLKEYVNMYTDSLASSAVLKKDSFARLKEFSQWKTKLLSHWSDLSIESVEIPAVQKIKRGDVLDIQAIINLGDLDSKDICVECYYGTMGGDNTIINGDTDIMEYKETKEKNIAHYHTKVTPKKGGAFGYSVRVLPKHELLHTPYSMGLIYWYE